MAVLQEFDGEITVKFSLRRVTSVRSDFIILNCLMMPSLQCSLGSIYTHPSYIYYLVYIDLDVGRLWLKLLKGKK